MPSLDIIIPAFNAAHCLDGTLRAIAHQTVSSGMSVSTIVVNNASTDDTAVLIDRWAEKGVRRVDFKDTQSRSATRNAGVAASTADYVLLLDADCRLAHRDCLSAASEAIAQDIEAGFGYTTGISTGFWQRYHRSLEAERLSAGWRGFTTACCLVKRELFNAVGGFSLEYRHYGFEDRDFICRLKAHAGSEALVSLPSLRAVHDDDLTVPIVCEKMYVAGCYSGEVFKRHFPDEYLATGYARVDVDTAPRYMAVVLRALQPFKSLITATTDRMTRWRYLPLAIGRPLVKLSSALSYFAGTRDRDNDQ
jgi:glycosyltransferase involved in cell wall biosynthesis